MKTRIDVQMTDEEFIDMLANHFSQLYGNRVLTNFYRYSDGSVEFSIETSLPEQKISPAAQPSPSPLGPALTEPFTVTPIPIVVGAYPRRINDYYPSMIDKRWEQDESAGGSIDCKCKQYGIWPTRGWVDAQGQLHSKDACEQPTPTVTETDDDIPF